MGSMFLLLNPDLPPPDCVFPYVWPSTCTFKRSPRMITTLQLVHLYPYPSGWDSFSNRSCKCFRFTSNATFFVNASARFVAVGSYATRIIPAATASRLMWKLIELCFFVNLDSGILAFLNTASLSMNTLQGPSIGIPKLISLRRSAINRSRAILSAVDSDPYVADSTEFCLLLNWIIHVFWINMRIPVCDLLVTTLPAWLASTKQLIVREFPNGSGPGLEKSNTLWESKSK